MLAQNVSVHVHNLSMIEKSWQITFIQETKSLLQLFYTHAGKNHIEEFAVVAFS